ncbi:MAG: ATP-binding cassette domain-containing protein [Paludibacteraceae bacterium]|nr:ATP-binding cassette domain-containing protein [Paludibacteraceae bacterium]
MEGNEFVILDSVTPRIPGVEFKAPLSFSINKGEAWAFYGENGSGKSLIAQIIKGQYGIKSGEITYAFMEEERRKAGGVAYPSQFIRIVGFEAAYTMSSFRDAYYQQRFSSMETDWYPKVRELLPDTEEGCRTAEMLNLVPLMDSSLITLSSGQLRRLLIAKAMLEHPRMLIFDNPFIGLDVKSRKMLNSVFKILMEDGVQLIFLTPTLRDIPPVTTNVLYLDKLECRYAGLKKGFDSINVKEEAPVQSEFDLSRSGYDSGSKDFDVAVKMEHLDIDYADVVYQHDLNWTIRKGEKWALLGPNGSGKSTLLSYIFADNPQAYSKPLMLFDRKRGTGESIWDIKRHMGFTSSEMHLYYLENVPCHSVVESGFFDSVGLYRRPSEEQKAFAMSLMAHLGIDGIAEKGFLKVSSGEQRLVLFARAVVKNPDLLILDEPFHGIDFKHKMMCLKLIDTYLKQKDKSIIFVTHYREEIPKAVEKIFELKVEN